MTNEQLIKILKPLIIEIKHEILKEGKSKSPAELEKLGYSRLQTAYSSPQDATRDASKFKKDGYDVKIVRDGMWYSIYGRNTSYDIARTFFNKNA